ncbi:MAG TPA: hypothetical protein VNT50_02735 [Microbacterium sp.]|uniref:hypothetical protein n=1 Tax=Microbacterium sp. TaxID=51671 RepID=UPI002C89605E|nr:hypothetical protein [Microbacterium sp.]HWI30379.1 hypothetical protein [Microbacterium sp.]
MSERLRFPDRESRDDALTFASRAARLADPTVRLRASAGVLAMTAAALVPRDLVDPTPTVLALRTLAVDPELECDLIVEASLLTAAADEDAIVLPDAATRAAWAGVSPPRGGWVAAGELDASALAARAHDGMARVASALPPGAGEEVVHRVRAGVWGESVPEWHDLPLGIAFAAVALGFISGTEHARVFTAGAWTRVSLSRGHLLVRGPAAMGLTAVRSTGRAG